MWLCAWVSNDEQAIENKASVIQIGNSRCTIDVKASTAKYVTSIDFDVSVSAFALFILYCYAVVVSFYMELKESKKKKHADSESTPLIDKC